jgi:hypothetical protein
MRSPPKDTASLSWISIPFLPIVTRPMALRARSSKLDGSVDDGPLAASVLFEDFKME